MPLDFADFAYGYQGYGLSDQEQRTKFEAFADLMECITRQYWPNASDRNRLGITLDGDSLAMKGTIDSDRSITFKFNDAASGEAAGEKDS